MLYYHNPRCSKSRVGLKLLQEKGVAFQVKEYLKEPLTVKEIAELSQKLKKKPQDLIRVKEEEYKELNLGREDLSLNDWCQVIVDHPVLLERPILVHENQAAIGRPPEKLLEIL